MFNRRQMITVAVVGMSVGLTGVMSLLFHRALRLDMLTTGFVCALVIDRIVNRISGHYRRRLAIANETLERRVRERTAELERTREEIIMRDRMATAGMLAAGVSHEIRSPLAVIRMLVDTLGEASAAADRGADEREMIADLGDAADRIALIVRDLASIARPVDDPLGPVELDAVISSAARLASYQLGKDATIEHVPADVPPVHGNAARLVQLVLNLLVNAARASRADAPNTIRTAARRAGDRVILAISDTGTGMAPETLARLFEPFFTTGRDRGGTGLGMTICRSIAERMGGTIEVTSQLGQGTTVEVSLRCAS